MYINEKIFFQYFNCPTKAWLMLYSKTIPQNNIQLLIECHLNHLKELAYQFFDISPKVIINKENITQAIFQTYEAINNKEIKLIFNPIINIDYFIAEPDILIRVNDNEFQMIDIKITPYKKTKINDENCENLKRIFLKQAFNYKIARECNITISKVFIMYVSTSYKQVSKNNNLNELFELYDCTNEVKLIENIISKNKSKIVKILAPNYKPNTKLLLMCKNCDFLNQCSISKIKNPIFNLININKEKFDKILKDGYQSIDQIPDNYFQINKDKINYIIHQCTKYNHCFISKNFKKILNKIEWPVHYLDFESFHSILPLYKNASTYENLIIQYSLHIRETQDQPISQIKHHELLIKPKSNYKLEFLKSLLSHIQKKGTIMIFSNFEKTYIQKMVEEFPQFKTHLLDILNRIFDMYEFIKKNFYHPNFNGSYSLKKILPILINDMNHNTLDISNGEIIVQKFHEIFFGNLSSEKKEILKKQALTYCAFDTLALVKIHEKFIKIANSLK